MTLGSAIGLVTIPLNPDPWTDLTIGLANSPALVNTKGTLDASGQAKAQIKGGPVNASKFERAGALPRLPGLRRPEQLLHGQQLVYDDPGEVARGSTMVSNVSVVNPTLKTWLGCLGTVATTCLAQQSQHHLYTFNGDSAKDNFGTPWPGQGT